MFLTLVDVCEKNKVDIVKKSKFFLYLFCLAIVFHRINFDYKFYKYQIQISKCLNKCTGIFQLKKINSTPSISLEKHTTADNFKNKLLDFHSWQILYISFIYPRTKIIKSIILPPSLAPIIDDKICKRKNENHKNSCSQLYQISSELTALNETKFVRVNYITLFFQYNFKESNFGKFMFKNCFSFLQCHSGT